MDREAEMVLEVELGYKAKDPPTVIHFLQTDPPSKVSTVSEKQSMNGPGVQAHEPLGGYFTPHSILTSVYILILWLDSIPPP